MLLLEIHMKGGLKTAQPIRTDKEETCSFFTTVATYRERGHAWNDNSRELRIT
jgi:hypothetical protein